MSTLSDRLLRWVEYFSLFDFGQDYLPGDDNVLPDHLSRPATSVCVICLEDAQPIREYDLIALGAWLHEHQHVCPPSPLVCPVLSETRIQSELRSRVRQAQAQDPGVQDIRQKLEAAEAQPSAFLMIYALEDGLVVIPEHDGRTRLLVPDGSLQQDICKYFHDEAGHPGIHRTLHAINTYFFWPNMSKTVRQYVASCAVCQAAKGANRLPGGFADPTPCPMNQALIGPWTFLCCLGQPMASPTSWCSLIASLNW